MTLESLYGDRSKGMARSGWGPRSTGLEALYYSDRAQMEEAYAADRPIPESGLFWSNSATPRVALFLGFRGKGKTLGTVTLAHIIKRAWNRQKIDNQLIANFTLNFADYCSPTVVAEMSKYDPSFSNSLVVIDELAEVSQSKRAMGRETVQLESVMRQIRHIGADILCSTQFVSDITGAFQRQVDYLIIPDLYQKWAPVKRDGKSMEKLDYAILTLYVWNWSGSITGHPLQHRYFPPPLDTAQTVITIGDVGPIMGMYSTTDVVIGSGRKDTEEVQANLEQQGLSAAVRMTSLTEKRAAASAIFGMESELDFNLWCDRARQFFLSGHVPATDDEKASELQRMLEILDDHDWNLIATDTPNEYLVSRVPAEGS